MVAAASGPVARTAFREDRMSDEKTILSGPDLAQGVALSAIPDKTMLLGHAHGEQVLLVRRGHELFAIGATCTHYGARSEEHTSELQSLMRISYAVFCLKKKNNNTE